MTKYNFQLSNTDNTAKVKQAQAQMQQLLSITQSGNWEQIVAILQNQIQTQSIGKDNIAGSIFSVASDVGGVVSGDANQQAAACQSIFSKMADLLDNTGMNESARARKAVQQQDEEVSKTSKEADNLHQSLDVKIQDIVTECQKGRETVEDAMKKIEALGGDQGQIAAAREELDQHLKTIEENKEILNDGVSDPEAKKQALVNILEAAGAINSLVLIVDGYAAQITEQNSIVEKTTKNVTDLTTDAANVLSQGMSGMAAIVGKEQQLTVQATEMGATGVGDTTAGGVKISIGEAMTSGVQAMFTGAEGIKYIMSGNDNVSAGGTLISGSTKSVAELVQSIGEEAASLQFFANIANGIGQFTDGFTGLVGEYDAMVNPSIEAIGSWEHIAEANEQLQNYVAEYTSDMGGSSQYSNLSQNPLGTGMNGNTQQSSSTQNNSNMNGNSQQSSSQPINWGVDMGFGSRVNLNDKNTEIQQTDANELKFKLFEFDTNVFNAN